MTKRARKFQLTDPINRLDLTPLSPEDRLRIEMLQSAYDRGGPPAVAEGMAALARSNEKLFGWLVTALIAQA